MQREKNNRRNCVPFRNDGLKAVSRFALETLERRTLLSLAAPITYNVGTETYQGGNGFASQVVTGDFNVDGKLDMAVSSPADNTVSVFEGNGNGTFQPAVSYAAGISGPIWMAVADFNGDGKPDIAVEGGSQVSILINNGSGGFLAPVVYNAGTQPRGGLAVGDFFSNGRQDIALAEYDNGSGVIAILPNNGNGTFGALDTITLAAAQSPIRSIVAGNFGNGHIDLAVAAGQGENNTLNSANPAAVAVYMNNGSGQFTLSGDYVAAVTPDPGGGDGTGDTVNPEYVASADLNHDGKLDLVLSLYDHNIDVFLNNGNGTFGSAEAYGTETPASVGGYPRGIAFGDINGDGNIDIVTDNFGEPSPVDQTTTEPGSIGVLYGNGNGTFQSPIQYTKPYTYPGGVAVGDFNGDGLADIAATQNYTGHSVSVLLNQPNTAQEPPTVTGLSVNTGPISGGTSVTISGTNFTGSTVVDFGSVPATSFKVNSTTSITAIAPAESASLVDITVYNAGASATNVGDEYKYSTAAPTVTGVSPATGSTSGGTNVTITGTNFSGVSAVKFGTVNASSFTVTSLTSIIATAPAEAAASVDLVVTTSAGASAISSADRFTFVASVTLPAPIAISPGNTTSPGPVITTLTPTFTWHGISGVTFTGYQINLFDVTTQAFISYTTGTSVTSFTIPSSSPLVAGNTYEWNVRAINGTQSGPPSAYFYFQTPAAATLPAPVAVSPGSTTEPGPVITTLTPTFTWQAINGVTFTGYQINLFNVTTQAFVSYTTGASVTSFTIPSSAPLTAGQTYLWNVRALNGTVSGPPSAYLYFQTPPVATKLTGTIIGTAGSYENQGNTIAKAFDGSFSTYFDGPTANGNYVGLDLGSADIISEIAYAPRSTYANRMVGGIFQGSNSADFSSSVNLFTITTAPAYSVLTTVNVESNISYRYVRYVSPNGGYGNVAELDFYGSTSVTTKLTGTTIGTPGSYQNDGNTIAMATDGNLSTFFDAPTANGNWVGLDLGTSKSISQVAFAPRSGFASRMVGGLIQISTTADFSSGVTTIYTISTTPTTGSLTTITLSSPVTARYIRYLSPSGSYGNISEFQVFGDD